MIVNMEERGSTLTRLSKSGQSSRSIKVCLFVTINRTVINILVLSPHSMQCAQVDGCEREGDVSELAAAVCVRVFVSLFTGQVQMISHSDVELGYVVTDELNCLLSSLVY